MTSKPAELSPFESKKPQEYLKHRVHLAFDVVNRHDLKGTVLRVERRGRTDYLVVEWDSGATSKRLPWELVICDGDRPKR